VKVTCIERETLKMKKLIIILALATLAGTSYAGALDLGSQELGVSGLLDFDTLDGTYVDVQVKYGYFWIDDLEFGGVISFRDDNRLQEWKLGGFAEYNFRIDSPVTPYIGAALTYGDSDITIGAIKEGTGAIVGDFNAGIKYFLVENVALDTDFVFSIASDDIFPEKDKVSDTDWKWRLGLRFYF
jgi:hypothetical protein